MLIEIDNRSGFCFGVRKAIEKAEAITGKGTEVLCLGEIVHNQQEVGRLEQLGMKTIGIDSLNEVSHQTVMIRTHGEPPDTYNTLKANNNTIIDATCPVVLKLQQRIKQSYEELQTTNGQLLIYGKKGHAEVLGLNGQTGNQAIVVSTVSDLEKVDFSRPIELYCQTTMPLDGFEEIKHILNSKSRNKITIHDTICRQVANRVPHIEAFAKQFEVILFVSGKNSSNGKLLFEVCQKSNPQSYFISSPSEVEASWMQNIHSVGVCGATSTPHWLLEMVKDEVVRISRQ